MGELLRLSRSLSFCRDYSFAAAKDSSVKRIASATTSIVSTETGCAASLLTGWAWLALTICLAPALTSTGSAELTTEGCASGSTGCAYSAYWAAGYLTAATCIEEYWMRGDFGISTICTSSAGAFIGVYTLKFMARSWWRAQKLKEQSHS